MIHRSLFQFVQKKLLQQRSLEQDPNHLIHYYRQKRKFREKILVCMLVKKIVGKKRIVILAIKIAFNLIITPIGKIILMAVMIILQFMLRIFTSSKTGVVK